MKKTTVILILVLISLFVLTTVVKSGGYEEYVSKGYVINNFCMKNGICTLDYLTVYNLSVIGQVFNVTMNLVTWNITESFNVGGDLQAKNITALDNFIGDGSLITGITASSVEDVWVNESGDTMTGTLTVPNITSDDGTLEIPVNITTEFINKVKFNTTIESGENRAILNMFIGG